MPALTSTGTRNRVEALRLSRISMQIQPNIDGLEGTANRLLPTNSH
jgi:hypothetical protein